MIDPDRRFATALNVVYPDRAGHRLSMGVGLNSTSTLPLGVVQWRMGQLGMGQLGMAQLGMGQLGMGQLGMGQCEVEVSCSGWHRWGTHPKFCWEEKRLCGRRPCALNAERRCRGAVPVPVLAKCLRRCWGAVPMPL